MKIFFAIILAVFPGIAFSQVRISGKVIFRDKGVKEVSVTLKDTYDGATTDESGKYSFETSEKGNHILVFSNPKYEETEISIFIADENITKNISIKAQYNEIDALVITAGSMEASDKKRASALLTPIDIYTTAGADAQLTSALSYLPGVQKVGESEGLFVRGGTGTETKIFMDGSLINNFFSSSVPGIAGRDRFNTSLFKGNIFSSGGYSALYGQALSGILILESVDLPSVTSFDVGVSPVFLNANYQKLSENKTYSYGVSAGYSNIGLMQKLFSFNNDFTKSPQGFNSDANFRIKTKGGGFLKYYGSFDNNAMKLDIKQNDGNGQYGLSSENTYHNLSYREKFGKYLLNIGSSYSYRKSDLDYSFAQTGQEIQNTPLNERGNYFNFKTVAERKFGKISTARAGFEWNNSHETNNYNKDFRDSISALFAETDLGFSPLFSAKIGMRAEHSSYLQKTNIAPRLAFAYRISNEWTTSLAYGIFYQNPESKYLNSDAKLTCQKAEHYIFQVQKTSPGRSLRLEAFYKNYDRLEKTIGNEYIQTAYNNSGSGMAKGFELFWRDKKTIKSIDYWISYSYLDTKRDFLNFPSLLTPNFAAKNTLNVVAKKFATNWKTNLNVSYTYASGRPYYDIVTDNGQNILRNYGKLKDYSSLNFSVNYLPFLGKKNGLQNTVFVLLINNVLGSKNIYGYRFSDNGTYKSPILPSINTFVFVGAFISFGLNKTDEFINNSL